MISSLAYKAYLKITQACALYLSTSDALIHRDKADAIVNETILFGHAFLVVLPTLEKRNPVHYRFPPHILKYFSAGT